MKLSKYLVNFLYQNVSDSIFLVSGGGIMHLVDSVGQSKLNAYCCHHEQACTTAAEGYARIKNKPGMALVTTGPGGTNAITGVAGAWLDSIPILVINGQVKTDNIVPRYQDILLYRQLGFQEINNVDMVKPITKYAVTVYEPDEIKYHLQKAIYLATHGRPGPVWLEIPLDVQAANINPDKLRTFKPPAESEFKQAKIPTKLIVEKLKKAKRPLLLAGNGIRLAGAEKQLNKFLAKTKINAATVIFTADDLITYDYPYYLGRQGIPGNKSANWAIDNCDLLLIIGDRLQLTQTSYDYSNFTAQATKIMVDIDPAVLHKKTINIDIPICVDAKEFLQKLNKQALKIKRWPIKVEKPKPEKYEPKKGYVNVYRFLQELGKRHKNYHVTTANGMASLAPHQGLYIKKGQRFLTNAGLGQMGSGLTLAIGACVASGNKATICSTGDGSIMFNIQELQTIKHHRLPIKIFIYNNNGYYSIRQTHKAYFKRLFASGPESGVSIPDFSKLIPAWGLPYFRINNDNDLHLVKKAINTKGPTVCEIILDPDQPTAGKWTAGQFSGKKK